MRSNTWISARTLGLVGATALGVAALSAPPWAAAELRSLDDGELSGVRGQSGLLIEAGVNVKFDAISYFDDAQGVSLRNVTLGAVGDPDGQARHRYEIDVTDTGGILTQFQMDATRLVIGDIGFSDSATRSLGSVLFDFTSQGTLYTEAYQGSGLKFNLDATLSDGRLGWSDSGSHLLLDDLDATVSIRDLILAVAVDPADPGATPFISLRLPDYRGTFSVGAIRYSSNPADFGATDTGGFASYGGLRGDYHAASDYALRGGGRVGASGLTLDVRHQLHSANLYYRDDTQELALKDLSGHATLDNLTLDVAPGANGNLGLLLGFDRWEGALRIGSLEAPRRLPDGSTGTGSFGALDLVYEFADQTIGGELYSNRFLLQAQGHPDAGDQGLSLQAQWSLPRATIRYADDGHPVYLSGISSYGRGTVTLDVTRAEVRNGTQFFDGLRVGFDNLRASYRIDGLRIGDPVEGREQPLQGGSELLLALGLYPAYDFTLDGHYSFAPGGAAGEGITVNADLQVTDGSAGIAALRLDAAELDETGQPKLKGLWATGIDYDIHLRDMTVDVTPDGLAIVQGESWSTMDIGDLRVGDKASGASFGRFVFQKYETGSSMVISPGGAGNVCVGGSGGDRASCQGDGGIWEERGAQGVTIALKQIFAEAVDADKRNRFVWETNRRTGADGRPVNGSGTQLIVDNITTNDGVDGSNSYGFRNDLHVDVYQTKVVKKATGYDANGVYGEKGQEKILDPASAAGYRYATLSGPDDPLLADRPLGFAVKARTHFKELSIERISLKHPDVAEPATLVYGMKLQNFDITSNLTATPIQ